MTGLITEIMDAFSVPSTRHAMVVHAPLVLVWLAIPVVFVSAVRPRSVRWRLLAIAVMVIVAASAYVASQSGLDAEGSLHGAAPEAAVERLEQHESMGSKVWLMAAGTAILLAVGFIPRSPLPILTGGLGVLASIGVATWTGVTGHHGGVLVYEYGVGTANPVLRAPEPSAAPQEDAAPSVSAPEEGVDGSAGGDAEPAAEATPPPITSPNNDPRLALYVDSVRPLLDDYCVGCHRPRKQRGGLDLSSIETILVGGDSGPAVLPGRPEESLLIELVTGTHPEIEQMPPDEEPLPPDEIALLERWIRDGAVGR